MGIYVALSSGIGLVMRLVGGWVADHHTIDGFRASAVMLALGGLGMVALAHGHPALVLPGAILGYGAGWGWSGLFHLGVVRTYPHAPASASGLSLLGLASGAAIGPFAFGRLAGDLGYSGAWAAATVVMLAGATMVWLGSSRLSAVAGETTVTGSPTRLPATPRHRPD